MNAPGTARQLAAGLLRSAPLLSIVVPTFNERDNIAPLVARLHDSLRGLDWEVVFVDDDSPDGTAEAVREIAAIDTRVRCLQRIGRRGLSSACIEGMLSSSAPYLAVMDGDLQHDERLLPAMLLALQGEPVDVVVGSRYAEGGGLGAFGAHRIAISRLATRVSHLVVPATLRDPMSGFFAIRRDAFMGCVRQLSAMGFKILVDLFASSPRPLRFRELPFTFRERVAGQSKLDTQVAWDYGMLLLDKLVGHVVPVRFIAFSLIGSLGVLVHLAVLGLLFRALEADFVASQLSATLVAMVFNFALNNRITYRDRQLHGLRWVRGLASFMAACSVGALANVGMAAWLYQHEQGWLLAALAGILVGAVWNYAITAVYTWGRARP
ncbi:MAG: glycosyltransferase family 2 protein [Burkholderiales bacterium]|nr:glycosyltransferase family 2 protein [Burkholderiales bacterium]